MLDAAAIRPDGHVGHEPRAVRRPSTTSYPAPTRSTDADARDGARRALAYMGLKAGTPIRDIAVDTVFIGSCTNSRIEDLRAAAAVARDRTVRDGMRALVVPGSMAVKAAAEAEGLDDGVPSPPDSSGARPGARCAWR